MSEESLRYAAAACQVDFGNPADRAGIKPHTDRMLAMIEQAVEGYSPFVPVKLLVFPGVRARRAGLSDRPRAARPPGHPDPQRAHRALRRQGP
jgi:hypothetical protein